MLNMALLNIMGGKGGLGGGIEDVSDFNIFGLMCPAITSPNIHFPATIHIWNRYLTSIIFNFRCEVKGGSAAAHVTTSVGAYRICGKDGQDYYNTSWVNLNGRVSSYGIALNASEIYFGERGMLFNYHDFKPYRDFWGDLIDKPTDRQNTVPTEFGVGYADYWNYLPPLPGQLDLNVTANLADAVGGHVWQCGTGLISQTSIIPCVIFQPVQRFSNGNYSSTASAWDNKTNWLQKVVPIRGLTNHPAFEEANQMMYGFAQIENPQIGYGEAYTWGVAKNKNCLPTGTSVWKCGKQAAASSSMPNKTREVFFAPKIFPGFAPFNLDDFLKPFKDAGHLNSLADAEHIFSELIKSYYNPGISGITKGFEHAVRSYGTVDSPWDRIWGAGAYSGILREIGQQPQYYWNALQREYPNECNFHSVLGCGRSFDGGPAGNATICALNDAMSVFNAMRLHPDTFPVDIAAL